MQLRLIMVVRSYYWLDESIFSQLKQHVRNTKPALGKSGSIRGVGGSVATIGRIMFYFIFGGREYEFKLNFVPNGIPLIISHYNKHNMGLNYQPLYKLLNAPNIAYLKRLRCEMSHHSCSSRYSVI